MEEIKELPTTVSTINRSLDELKEQIAIISREILRIAHLKNGSITCI